MIAVDAGYFIALADASDRWHSRALALWPSRQEGWISTWPVLTEACHLLSARLDPEFAALLMDDVADGSLAVWEPTAEHTRRVPGLMRQLKPINYFGYRFSIYVSARLVTGLLILLPVLVTYPLLKDYLAVPPEWWRLALGLPALAMSALIQFGIAYCFGLLSFWLLEIQGMVILSMALESVLGGQIFPLDLLPDGLFRISQFLPYYYQMYFPVAIFTGRLNDPVAIVSGLGIQACWVVVILALGQFLWTRGLRLHTAVGG